MKNNNTHSFPRSMAVELLSSDNTFLSYPVKGRIEIIEYTLDGRISAIFYLLEKGTGPVVVKNPVFTYGK